MNIISSAFTDYHDPITNKFYESITDRQKIANQNRTLERHFETDPILFEPLETPSQKNFPKS